MSSSSSASFDPNNNNSNNISASKSATTPGCLAAILRRILCSKTLPSDQITNTDTQVGSILCEKDLEWKSEDKAMPSLVARLMGLEGVPNSSTGKISRSRSMNSLDFEASSGQTEGDDNKHRRVKSSTLSIQEMPTFFEVENEEFFVLSFGNRNEDEEKRTRRKKCEMGRGELKQRRGDRCRNKEQGVFNKPENPCVGSEIMEFSTPIKNNEVYEGAKLRRRRKKKKKKVQSIELESNSEDSSPVSVLDFDQFIMSELDCSNLVESNSRRKLSPEPDQNYDCQSPRNDNNLMILDVPKPKKSEGKCVGSRKRYIRSHNYFNICDQIYKMTDGEVAESNWLHRKNMMRHEDFEEISADLGSQILDQSLDELVHQLIGLAM
ncbi:uncharacterized protein LOC116129629 [Pistacia vera]|uniref:uncharacterized protein LOC116129629 n=1 Tax=Pistacia vera TaxID=55513 RepID=UPI0012635762|nr:uncharacterized protein LOC116129629 [Pistacia vera]